MCLLIKWIGQIVSYTRSRQYTFIDFIRLTFLLNYYSSFSVVFNYTNQDAIVGKCYLLTFLLEL